MSHPLRHTTAAKQVDELKGPNGENLCRWCKSEVKPPKRTFCGNPECLHQWKIRSDGGYAREQVYQRDRGVCASCKLDTDALKALLYKVRTQKGESTYLQLLNYYKEQFGFNFDVTTHFWESDHIKPVAEGGGSCGLDNLQTLCRVCHKHKTFKQFQRSRRKRTVNEYRAIQRAKQNRAYKEFEDAEWEDQSED